MSKSHTILQENESVIRELASKGVAQYKIAAKLGVDAATLSKFMHTRGIKANPKGRKHYKKYSVECFGVHIYTGTIPELAERLRMPEATLRIAASNQRNNTVKNNYKFSIIEVQN